MYIDIDFGWFIMLIAFSFVGLVLNIATFISTIQMERHLDGIPKDK